MYYYPPRLLLHFQRILDKKKIPSEIVEETTAERRVARKLKIKVMITKLKKKFESLLILKRGLS